MKRSKNSRREKQSSIPCQRGRKRKKGREELFEKTFQAIFLEWKVKRLKRDSHQHLITERRKREEDKEEREEKEIKMEASFDTLIIPSFLRWSWLHDHSYTLLNSSNRTKVLFCSRTSQKGRSNHTKSLSRNQNRRKGKKIFRNRVCSFSYRDDDSISFFFLFLYLPSFSLPSLCSVKGWVSIEKKCDGVDGGKNVRVGTRFGNRTEEGKREDEKIKNW